MVMHEDCVLLVLVGNRLQISSLVPVQHRRMRLSRSGLDRKGCEFLLGFCLRMLQISTAIEEIRCEVEIQTLEEGNTAFIVVDVYLIQPWVPSTLHHTASWRDSDFLNNLQFGAIVKAEQASCCAVFLNRCSSQNDLFIRTKGHIGLGIIIRETLESF